MSARTDHATSQAAGSAAIAPRPIRVLCVTFYGDRAEAATFAGLHRSGCEVTVYCMPGSPYIETFRAAGIRVIDGGFRGRFDREAIARLRAELERGDFDIVHLLHNRPVSNGLQALRAFPKPKVVAYRGIVGHVSPLSPMSWVRYLNPRIDRLICVCEAVRQYFLGLRLLNYRVPREKPVTIYKGHELHWYDGPAADLAPFDVPPGALVVGCVANARRRKGIDVLVEAFGRLPADLPVYLLLVGHMESATLDAKIAASPNAARIRKIGFRRDAPAVIAACSIAVLPALWGEGLPRAIVEAMARGVVPVVTDAGGSPELVGTGSSGIVVPPGDPAALADALLTLCQDPAMRERMGRAARERIAHEFSNSVTVAKTLALYRELLAGSGGPAA